MAYLFDGTNDYLRSSANGVSGIDTNTFTMAAWVYSTNDPSGDEILFETSIDFSAVASGRERLQITTPTTSGFVVRFLERRATTNGIWMSDDDISGSAWHHICVTKDGAGVGVDPVIYVDGSSVASTEDTTPVGARLTGNDSITIGVRSGDQANDLDGRGAEWAFWGRALSADEVSVIGSAKLSPLFIPDGLVWYAPCVRELNEWFQAGNASLTATGATVTEHPPVVYPTVFNLWYAAAAAPPAGGISAGSLALTGVGV